MILKKLRALWRMFRQRITTPKWFIDEMALVRASQIRSDEVADKIMQLEIDLSKR